MRLFAPLLAILSVLIGPFLLAESGGWSGQRSFSNELGSTLGISALGVLEIVLILPTRLPVLAGLGADSAVRLHRHLVGVLMALLVGHVVLAVALQPARHTLLRFIGQPWRAQAAIASTCCLLALVGASIWRRRLRIRYAGWRALHGGLAAATLCLAGLHTFGWHRYLGNGAGELGLAGLVALPLGALAALRLKPRSRPIYLLDRTVHEAGRSTSVVLRAHDHCGQRLSRGSSRGSGSPTRALALPSIRFLIPRAPRTLRRLRSPSAPTRGSAPGSRACR